MDYFQRSNAIAEELRAQIVSGKLEPGDRLPTRIELTRHYGVSSVTVQRALDQLREDGFVEAAGRRGTYVAGMPPHLSRYAIIFPGPFKNEQPTNLFFRALLQSARELETRVGEFCIYSGFEGRDGFDAYDVLIDDLRSHRVAGLIFASPPHGLQATPLLDTPGVPLVAFGSRSEDGLPTISFDNVAGHHRLMEALAQHGCRRPGAVINPGQAGFEKNFRNACEKLGMTFQTELVQGMPLDSAAWAHRLTRLLFALPEDKRPDGLLIGDDNLAEPVTRALAELGLRSPEDLPVAVQCNFPLDTPAAFPVIRIGFDVEQGLREGVRIINRLRLGKSPEERIVLPVLSETEWRRQHESQ